MLSEDSITVAWESGRAGREGKSDRCVRKWDSRAKLN